MIETKDTRHYHAFLMILFTLIGFSVFILLKVYSYGLELFFAIVVILAFVIMQIFVLHRRKHFEKEALFVPLFMFLGNTIGCFITGSYSNYFSSCLVICCLGALFFNKRELLKYIIISNLIIAAQVVYQIPKFKLQPDGPMGTTAPDLLLSWFIYLAGSIAVYMVTDLAENKTNDARKARDFLIGTLISTPDPMILLDPLARVTYISDSFMKMIHVENPYHAKGRPVFDILKYKNLRDLFYELLSKNDSSQTAREVILNGQQYFFDIVVTKLTEGKGYLINIIDITPVMKAKFEAEAASHSKSAFLATMSHEIRTPLNAIIGLSDIELQKELSEDARLNLERINSSGGSLLAIINDLLDISKIETGNFEMIPVDYDIPSLINDTVQLNIVRIGSKSVSFKLKIDETIPIQLYGDELRIKQILNNLLSNAFKYTDEGSVTLTISWEKREDKAWVIFSVRDTGHGIKQKDISKLFSEYRQLDARSNRFIEGTGLGLAITKKLLTLMDGKVRVESEYGKGSVFTVEIPQLIIDEAPIGETIARNLELFRFKETSQSQSLRLVRSYMPYGKVLVVDDVETNLNVAKGLMLPYGLAIDTALSGSEAIEKIKTAGEGDESSRYDIIFMDHMMPGMDGLEAVRIIRDELAGDYGRTVPIVALTANALVGNERMFLAHGFNAFISKPIDVMHLDAALNTWVRDKQSAETLKEAELKLAEIKKEQQDVSVEPRNISLEGIDFAQGRERYNGEAAYMEILRAWHLHTPALLETMKNNLSVENLAEYAVAVHGIKGSSYGILANDVAQKAQELETFARAGDFSNVQALNDNFIKMVGALALKLGELLEKAAAEKGAKLKKHEPDPALLTQLLEATKQYKAAIMEGILDEMESYDYESGGELVLWLREQMDNLEYDEICTKLESISINPPLPINKEKEG